MRQKIVAGNWKMNGSIDFTQKLLSYLASQGDFFKEEKRLQIIVFPPALYLSQTQEVLNNTKIAYGAQTVSQYDKGAYTGEISAEMLRDANCQFVIVGHSERRSLFNESNEVVAIKFAKAQSYGLVPILCVGETLEQRNQNQTFEVIESQLKAILSDERGVAGFKKAMIAYEPVWAIGTGQSATPQEAEHVHTFIRSLIAKLDNSIANDLPILYGGSVTAQNAHSLFKMPNIDGALVGGASLKADEFLKIAYAACEGEKCNS